MQALPTKPLLASRERLSVAALGGIAMLWHTLCRSSREGTLAARRVALPLLVHLKPLYLG